jgi:hypothetical protein
MARKVKTGPGDNEAQPEPWPFDRERFAAAIGLDVQMAIRDYGLADGRTLQSLAGIIGPSDLGFCRNRAALMVRGVEQTDSKSIWPAQVGTALHRYVGEALRRAHPDWVVDDEKLTATFPSGFAVAGTPDAFGVVSIVGDGWFLVGDVKTKDGLEDSRRNGSSQNHRFQRHTYALAVQQSGRVPDGHRVLVANIFLDRSGADEEVVVDVEEFDDLLTGEIDEWISDVTYAVTHQEDASRDIPAPVCEVICEHYTACRGGLPMTDSVPLNDPVIADWVTMYNDGHALTKKGEAMKNEAKGLMANLNGLVVTPGGVYEVRHTEVADTDIAGFTRRGYVKLDVRKARI